MKKTKLTLRKLSNVLAKKAPQNDVISALGDSDRVLAYSDCKTGEDCIIDHIHVNGDDGSDDDDGQGRSLPFPNQLSSTIKFTFDDNWQKSISVEFKHATDPTQHKLTFTITNPKETPSNTINLGVLLNKGETYNMKVVFLAVKYETLFQLK